MLHLHQSVAVVLNGRLLTEQLGDGLHVIDLVLAELLNLLGLGGHLQPERILNLLHVGGAVDRLVQKVQFLLQNIVTDVGQRFALFEFKYLVDQIIGGALGLAQLLRELLPVVLGGRHEVDQVLGAADDLIEVSLNVEIFLFQLFVL